MIDAVWSNRMYGSPPLYLQQFRLSFLWCSTRGLGQLPTIGTLFPQTTHSEQWSVVERHSKGRCCRYEGHPLLACTSVHS